MLAKRNSKTLLIYDSLLL